MAAEGDFMRYVITGEEDEDIPLDATHFSAHESVTVIRARLFLEHPNIVELICHDGVVKIEEAVFWKCQRLIIPGVKVVEERAFAASRLTYIECPNLEIIGEQAFFRCESVSDIDLPSVKVVELCAFRDCDAIKDVTFGKKLESLKGMAFYQCRSLQKITLPLKNGLIAHDNIFQGCENLHRVDLVEEDVLRETINALIVEEWRNDMNETIDSINHILPNTRAGGLGCGEEGGKARAIRRWIASVLRKIIHYKAQHRSLVQEIATALQFELPADAVMNYVLPFLGLELPKHTFDGEDDELGGGGGGSRSRKRPR